MASYVIDCAENYSGKAHTIKTLGAAGVMRYFNPLTRGRDSGKSLTLAEAKAWAAIGMPVGIVVEGYGLANGTGVDGPSGSRDAREVLAWLPTVGLLPNPRMVVYFAVDTDASSNQINHNEVAYFDAIRSVFLTVGVNVRPQIGIYGSGASCLAMVGTKRADHSWVAGSPGWTSYQTYVSSRAWTLLQRIYSHETWNGFNADTNQVNGSVADAGLQVPFIAQTQTQPQPQPQPMITYGTALPPVVPMPPVVPVAPSKGFFQSVVDSFKKL